MKLRSNFRDYYDVYFDLTPPVFRRVTTDGPNKREQLTLLQEAGYLVPPHGLVKDILGYHWEAERCLIRRVVAYEDEQAHCGEGKILLDKSRYGMHISGRMNPDWVEYERLGNLFCTAHVVSRFSKPFSWRRLQVGPHVFWLEYTSDDLYRSNCGDVDIKVISVEMNTGPSLLTREYPLHAIDFVLGQEMYAIDFNIAPGVSGSGIEDYLTGREFVEALRPFVY